MLRALRTHRTVLSPVTAGAFLLGIVLATAPEHAHAQPDEANPHAHHADQAHHPGHGDPAAPEVPEVPGHGCDVCLCFAAAGACSPPALAGEVTAPAQAPITLKDGLSAPADPPGASPPHDIFRPPRG